MSEEPADLLAVIGWRVFTWEFISHSKSTNCLTYVRNIRVKDYTGGMFAFPPYADIGSLALHV
jgi:hypothetical protein